MSNPSAYPLVSPDGRFEINVEETVDRFERYYDTSLIERATGRRLFSCRGTPRAEFAADGTLTVHYPGYEPGGLRIDPVGGVFRTRTDEPWMPLSAWPHIESAFGRGWAQAIAYRNQDWQEQFPWVAMLLLLGSVMALPVLCVLPLPSGNTRLILLGVAGAGVLLFGWLTAFSFRSWRQAKRWARTLDAARRSSK